MINGNNFPIHNNRTPNHLTLLRHALWRLVHGAVHKKAKRTDRSKGQIAICSNCLLALSLFFVCMLYFSPSVSIAAEVSSNKILKTALTGKFPPFSYYDKNGNLTGFDVDVSREIARRTGRKCKIITTEWDGILAGLLAGKYETIIGSMAVTPEREEQVLFSRPYYTSGAQLFVHRDNPSKIYSIDECDHRQIAVVLGETYQHFIEANYPNIQLVTLKSPAEIFEMLSQKRIDGFVTDRLVGLWQIKQADRDFVPIGHKLYSEKIAIPVKKHDTALLASINSALDQMEKDGTLKKIQATYFGLSENIQHASSTKMTVSVVVRKLIKGFGVTLGIALAAILLGLVLAIPCGVILAYPTRGWRYLRYLVRTVIDFIRGTPVLIQLLFVWMGLGLHPYAAAILTLGINAMAYMAEVVRSGLLGVDPGQARAAKALGLNKIQQFRHVMWPQAFRIAIPPLMNSIVALIKDTALVAVISIPEVIREAQSIISVTFEPTKYYLIIAVMFFVVTFPLMKLAGRTEGKIRAKGFTHD